MGGCQGSGAGFLATTLSFVMAEKIDGVTFVDKPSQSTYSLRPSLINQLSMEKVPCNNGLRMFHNINWIIASDYENAFYSAIDVKSVKGKYIVCNSPETYRHFDLIICVIDALPSKVVASKAKVEHLKEYFFNKVIWVINRDFYEDRRRIEKYLGIKFDFEMPIIAQEAFYKAERYGKPLAKTKFLKFEDKQKIGSIADYIVSLY